MWPDKLIPFLLIFVIIGLTMVLPTWLFWRIFGRTGMNPALSLLALIPTVGFFVVLAILAFGTWPALWAGGSGTPMPSPAGGPPSVPAGWLSDPTGAHRLRYWDGFAWTQHVNDDV